MAARPILPALKPRPVRPVTTVPLGVRQQPVGPRPVNVNPGGGSPFPWKQKAKPARPYTNISGTPRKRNWWTECTKQVAAGSRVPGRERVSPIEIGPEFRQYWNEVGDQLRLTDGKKCKEAINRYNRGSPFGGNVQFYDAPDYYGPSDPQNVEKFYRESKAPVRPAGQAVPPRGGRIQPEYLQSFEDSLADLERQLNELGVDLTPPGSPRMSPRGSPRVSPPSSPLIRRRPPPPIAPRPALAAFDDFDLPPLPDVSDINLSEFDFSSLPPPPLRR